MAASGFHARCKRTLLARNRDREAIMEDRKNKAVASAVPVRIERP
jgi:hypothetical protein